MKTASVLIVAVVLLGCSQQEEQTPPRDVAGLQEGTYAIDCIPRLESLHNPGETVVYDIGGEAVAGPDPEMGEMLTLSDGSRFAVFRTELPSLSAALDLKHNQKYSFVLRTRDHALLEVRLGSQTVYQYSNATNESSILHRGPFVAQKHGKGDSEQPAAPVQPEGAPSD